MKRGAAAPLDHRRARLVAADLLSRRAWTRADLTRRLRRRGAPDDVAVDVVTDLVARGHVDDAAFAHQWVATRTARGYGAGRLRAELSVRGVDAAVINAALAELDSGDALGRARAAAARRLSALRGNDPRRVATRLRDHLLRRGYPGGLVARVVRESFEMGCPSGSPHTPRTRIPQTNPTDAYPPDAYPTDRMKRS